MKRLVFVTPEYDPAGSILGISSDWVTALASRCPGVDVIALKTPPDPRCPANVTVAGLSGATRRARAAKLVDYYRYLAAVLPGASAVLVHMAPIFAVLAAPLTRLSRTPLMLWYSHGRTSRTLRIAASLSSRILTATRAGFPLTGPRIDRKTHVLGAGIDTDRFVPVDAADVIPGRLVAAGRISRAKRLELLLDGLAAVARDDWSLRLVGGPLTEADKQYEAELRAQTERLGLSERVTYVGMVPYSQMVEEFRTAWALAHTGATGGLDKVVPEAMACGTPPITTSIQAKEALGPYAAELGCEPVPDSIARRLSEALAWSPLRRAGLAADLRRHADENHSLRRWAEGAISVADGADR